MRPANRQRLIGLGLLVLLLLILVPWATQTPLALKLHPERALPPAPELTWEEPIAPISDATHQQAVTAIGQQRDGAVASNLDAEAALRAFALELQRFPKRAAAVAALKTLNDAGYHGYVRQHQDDFVLFAGPELELGRIKTLQKQLAADKKLGYTDISIQPYHP